jgi:DedD protein
MNDHNLDDLIIENIEPKNGKTKSLLTIIALLIVVLIVGIILTKIILKDPNADQIALEKENTEMISPELTLQNATKEELPKKEEKEKLSNIIENEPKPPIVIPKVEEVKKEIITEKKEVVKPVKEPVKEVAKKITKEPLPKTITESVKITKEFEQKSEKVGEISVTEKPEAQKEVKEIIEAKKEVVKTSRPLPEKMIEKAKERPTGKPVNAPSKKAVASSVYFIQVGSFRQTPSSRFLSIIKNSGFNYSITPPSTSGIKKLLIGPYENRKAVDAALVRVRDRINKQAFVIKK